MALAITILAPSLLVILIVYFSQRNICLTNVRHNLSMIIFPSNRIDRQQQDLASAGRGYMQYAYFAHRELSRMRSSYATVSREHKRMGFELGYARKLNVLAETIKANALITKGISELAREQSSNSSRSCGSAGTPDQQHLERIREVLKHFVRDWSEEGAEERAKTFSPILNELKGIPRLERKDMTILVPGAGLARLPWEIAGLGFKTTSNELSPYMNLAFRFLLSRSATPRIHQHAIHPFAHWFSHQRTNSSLFRTVSFPDALPSLFPDSALHHEESDFLNFAPVKDGYDYIVTHYFIDTSHNIIATVQKVHSLLKNGGTWINLGPLLYMSGAQATMELSLEEVLELSRLVGFEIQEDSRRTVPSEYTRDDTAMMRWIYKAEFWIAVKI